MLCNGSELDYVREQLWLKHVISSKALFGCQNIAICEWRKKKKKRLFLLCKIPCVLILYRDAITSQTVDKMEKKARAIILSWFPTEETQ